MKKKSEIIYYIKGWAIISVICAHCNSVLMDACYFSKKSSLLLQNIGTYGVICFFVISGFLFHINNDKCIFFKQKLLKICVPWWISSTIVYLYVHLRKPPISVKELTMFVLGKGSYCYYLTVLMTLYVIFFLCPIMRRKKSLFICEVVTIISILKFFAIGLIGPYLNVLNWIGYFAAGISLNADKKKINNIERYIKKYGIMYLILWLIMLMYRIYTNESGSYWGGKNVINCIMGAIAIVDIAVLQNQRKWKINRIIKYIGYNSFFIYLWHMPFAGIIANIMNRGSLSYFVFVRPVLVLIIVCLIKKILEIFISFSGKNLYWIVGINRS